MNIAERLRNTAEIQKQDRSRSGASDGRVQDNLLQALYMDVVDRLDTRASADLERDDVQKQVVKLVKQALRGRQLTISSRQEEEIVVSIVDEIVGLGPMEPLLADANVNDILVNGCDDVFVERSGVLERTNVRFRDNSHLLNTIRRIVARLGRRIDESSPMVDARLPDGSRVNAIIPPLALDGPVLSIRRFANGPTSFRELYQKGSINAGMSHYFKSAVRSGANILVCGGTGAGKTTLLNALSSYIPKRERVVTIEDSAELRLQQQHVVRLETRPPNVEGRGEITIRDLVRNALRMRPDRIIVGEVRADEVLDMIQAMNTGHEGSMTTVHANSVNDAFTRVVAMMSMAGTPLSENLMLQMVARAVHLVVQVTRDADGQRRVAEVTEVIDATDGRISTNTVYSLRSEDSLADRDESNANTGVWISSGKSVLLERFARAGWPLDERALRGRA